MEGLAEEDNLAEVCGLSIAKFTLAAAIFQSALMLFSFLLELIRTEWMDQWFLLFLLSDLAHLIVATMAIVAVLQSSIRLIDLYKIGKQPSPLHAVISLTRTGLVTVLVIRISLLICAIMILPSWGFDTGPQFVVPHLVYLILVYSAFILHFGLILQSAEAFARILCAGGTGWEHKSSSNIKTASIFDEKICVEPPSWEQV